MKNWISISCLLLLASCSRRTPWEVSDIRLPSGDIIRKESRTLPGFWPTYQRQWAIVWQESGTVEPLPGVPPQSTTTSPQITRDATNVCIVVDDQILWRPQHAGTQEWKREWLRGTPPLFAYLHSYVASTYPDAYRLDVDAASNAHRIVITGSYSHASQYVRIDEGGFIPYSIENLDLVKCTMTLRRQRRSDYVPSLIVLTNVSLNTDIDQWQVSHQ